ncbi:MAG: glucose-methanol-choline oxidoreductase [Hydrocarboniphaga sp.]|uniref:GMC family oxidoreductase n=1 Tax=Hydrocarboniphaga sp. TaxID=2033016 RepID=UPI0026137124|nr:GMC family oxidoreductase N-terminal domain-containing protein [Hydrocarboniphaga sp.]MDB5970159.1 glucose-methanol-choline oxidoreductase [Hydrocarboniphaga sp.]
MIVGAGAAGCVLAYRLSEDPKNSVALIEAGASHRHPFIDMPKGLGKILQSPKFTWPFPTEPEDGTAGEVEYWLRGKVLGGSTSVNGMMYVRGQPADFDEIAARSSDDWSWQHIGAAYAALESHELGAAETRGAKGPLRVSMPVMKDRLSEAMIAAGEAMGLPRKLDVNAPDNGPAVGYAPRTIYKGRRESAATAFIDPIRKRPNLTIITNAMVDRVLFDGKRATSVLASVDDASQTFAAKREIIIAGGALASPTILQRSGIGPADLLKQHGISVVHDSPQVGQNLIEHRALLMQWKLREPLSQNLHFSGLRLLGVTAQYFMKRTGMMASAAYEVGAWLKSRPELPRPDLQFLLAPFSFDFASKRTKLEPFHGIHTVAYPLRPTSRGEINIRSKNPGDMPILKPNYHSTAEDRRTMIDLIKVARQYANQTPLRALIEVETYPGPAATTDDELIAAYDKFGSCGFHAVGSCRMGSDAESVVDPELRVRGVDNLRVMDTSIIPQIPSGNTNGPTMAMAWRAADLILRA